MFLKTFAQLMAIWNGHSKWGKERVVIRVDGKDYDIGDIVQHKDGVLGDYIVINVKPLEV